MKRNPSWKPEELMLALELYLSHDYKWHSSISDKTPEIIALSHILRHLDFHTPADTATFRSTGSVRLKLANFKVLDPHFTKSSLENISSLDRTVWAEYSGDLPRLRKLCAVCIREHFHGQLIPEVISYLEHLDIYGHCHDIDYKSAVVYLTDLMNLAEMKGDHDISDLCSALAVNLQEKSREKIYIPHGGINREPVSGSFNNPASIPASTDKIGKIVRCMFRKLIRLKLLRGQTLDNLQDANWCKKYLSVSLPMLKIVDPDSDLKSLRYDENGYLRYYKDLYNIDGKSFILCKELYKKHISNFQKFERSLMLDYSADGFAQILKYILRNDQTKDFCISLSELRKTFGDEVDVVIEYLIKNNVLSQYQGSLREFVIDDYDILYLMLDEPQSYTVKGE